MIFYDFSKKTRKPNFEIWPWDPSRSLSHVLLSNMAQELCQTALLRSVSSHFKFSLELWSAGRPELSGPFRSFWTIPDNIWTTLDNTMSPRPAVSQNHPILKLWASPHSRSPSRHLPDNFRSMFFRCTIFSGQLPDNYYAGI